MKIILLLLVIFFSCSSHSEEGSEWDVIHGTINLSLMKERAHLPIAFSGETAKKLFESMNVNMVDDSCLGGSFKSYGSMICYVVDSDYSCEIVLDLKNNKLIGREHEFCI